MDYEEFDGEEEFEIITINIDNKDIECAVLGVFEVETKQYIALMPASEELDEEVLIFECIEHEEDIELIDIESDEEYQKAYEVFQNLLTEVVFDTNDIMPELIDDDIK